MRPEAEASEYLIVVSHEASVIADVLQVAKLIEAIHSASLVDFLATQENQSAAMETAPDGCIDDVSPLCSL
jgi:hypothetical protein